MVTNDARSKSRRQFLVGITGAAVGVAAGTSVLGGVVFQRPGDFAETLVRTPWQTEGPFFPDRLPLDSDNDLLVVDDALTPAIGEITHLRGRILDTRGNPIRGALVEIWQVDSNGVYLHSGSANRARRDPHFQGFGRFETGSTGEYYFRTIKPVPYSGRTPHIHVAVETKGRDRFTTQCYVKGHPMNARDGLLRAIRDPRARESVLVDFTPVSGSSAGELAAHFDVVLGHTTEG